MKTDNKPIDKTEYAEMVRDSIAPHILSEAASHTFEKHGSPASAWVSAACFALIFAAAAILLIKPMTERGEAAKVTASPDATKIAQTTPDAGFTPVPTPDIGNMRIIYGSADCIAIDDVQHKPGSVTLYGGLTEMLADEQYNNCIFAVDIEIQDYYLSDKHSEESDRLYAEFQNDPAVVRYNELYESFVRENADRYYEFLETYYYPSEFHSDFDSREKELEAIAEKYDETMVFPTAFRDHLESTGQEQILNDYAEAENDYYKKRSELWQDWENRPEEKELHKTRHDAEVERLKDCGLISKEYVYDGKTMLYWLLTRDQLLNFPASPEFAYIITPAVNRDDAPDPTNVPDSLAVDEAQAEHIINLLAEYHAAQFTRSAEIGELKLSENVLSDLEERQRCIDEMEKRICVYSGSFTNASVRVERLDIAPHYEPNGVFKRFTVLYYEVTTVDYGAGAPFSFGIDHTVTVAPDGTVLYDIFSEENSTGFSNHPFPNSGIIWTDAEIPASYYTSERYQYLAAAHALLEGGVPERTDFRYGNQYVHFRLEDDGLKAYVTVIDNATGEETEVTVAIIPREVGELAYRKLFEYWSRFVTFSEIEYDPTVVFEGFIGEDHFVLVTPDESLQDLQVHCIFYFDGSEWREITGCPGLYTDYVDKRTPYTIFGACVLDEDNALLCYYTKRVFGEGAQDNKLHIYRTENGGESWGRLDIVLPDYYINMDYYAPLTPVFDESGMHGVIILDSGIMANGESAPFGWLESLDGGISWEFRSLHGRGA